MTVASWPGPPEWPERPDYPYPPIRPMPRREGPVAVPTVDLPSGDAGDQLLARRRVLVTGPLDAEAATRLAAELMALDGRSADDVELYINSEGGPLADVLTVLDVVGLMRARVHAVCVGRATGTGAVLLAGATGSRRATPHALISMRCAQHEQVDGSPEQLRRLVEEIELIRRNVVAALVSATGRTATELLDELDHGSLLEPALAQELGIIELVDVRHRPEPWRSR